MGNQIAILILVIIAIASVIFVFIDKVEALFVGLTKNLRIKMILRKYVEKHDFLYLNNLCLRIAPKTYMHVDHVIIGDRFIYVISTKFYYGYLSGKDSDSKWVLCSGKSTEIIDNPLYVNENKIEWLAKLLKVNPSILVNVVLVSKTAHIDETVIIDNPNFHIVEEKDVTKLLDTFEDNKDYTVFAKEDLEKLADSLNTYHRMSVDDKRMNEERWNH